MFKKITKQSILSKCSHNLDYLIWKLKQKRFECKQVETLHSLASDKFEYQYEVGGSLKVKLKLILGRITILATC